MTLIVAQQTVPSAQWRAVPEPAAPSRTLRLPMPCGSGSPSVCLAGSSSSMAIRSQAGPLPASPRIHPAWPPLASSRVQRSASQLLRSTALRPGPRLCAELLLGPTSEALAPLSPHLPELGTAIRPAGQAVNLRAGCPTPGRSPGPPHRHPAPLCFGTSESLVPSLLARAAGLSSFAVRSGLHSGRNCITVSPATPQRLSYKQVRH